MALRGAAGATNLGHWKAAASYDEACKDLAELVGSEATLNVNDAVLCVGGEPKTCVPAIPLGWVMESHYFLE